MKKIFKQIQIVLLLLIAITAKAQLPLQFGDAVVTHSPTTASTNVLMVIKTSNTVTASPGTNWATPPKPSSINSVNYPAWTSTTFGHIFGIAIDGKVPDPNIYVSSTQIHGGPATDSKVYRVDGSTGAVTTIFDFHNSSRSLGNLKHLKIGTTEYLYVSNWEADGKIERLQSTNNGVSWTPASSFTIAPSAGTNADTMPYGIAIRKLTSGPNPYRLYYSRIFSNSPFSANDIWSVDLNGTGDFIPSTKQKENLLVSINLPACPSSICGSPYDSGEDVISDMAFSEKNNSILIGQQSWKRQDLYGFAKMSAHNSQVVEMVNLATGSGHTWNTLANVYPSGGGAGRNCAGGVSYSDNIYYKNGLSFACDTTVWFTADAIVAPSPLVYGLQGMKRGTGNTLSNSIWIDEDDNTGSWDKTMLGDVEVYKNPDACTTTTACNCTNSSWNNIKMGNSIWWTGPSTTIPTLTYTQGQPALTGVLFPSYNCGTNNCNATFTFALLKPDGTSIVLPNNSGSLDLAQISFNNLPCDRTYFIVITPICGTSNCIPVRIPLVYNCTQVPPLPCECKGTVTINVGQQSLVVTPQNNISTPNPVSTVTGSFTLNASSPVTEVRMLIEEFRLTTTTGNENCQLCKNKPQTWASINAATLSGVTSQTTIIPTLSNDVREFVFNNGLNSMFSLNGNTVNFTLAVPGVTGLNCCKLKGEVCIKFIIRDVNCCEREVLKCFSFEL